MQLHTHIYILDSSLQLFSLRNRELLPLLFPFSFSAAAALTASSRHDRAFIGMSTGDNGARVHSCTRWWISVGRTNVLDLKGSSRAVGDGTELLLEEDASALFSFSYSQTLAEDCSSSSLVLVILPSNVLNGSHSVVSET